MHGASIKESGGGGKSGALFVVATPIGNLGDITVRAVETLARVELILAEDRARAAALLHHLGIATPLRAFHQHNEARRVPALVRRMAAGAELALVSDAGTPLISDPGYPLVCAAAAHGIAVTPLPGPCAITAALCAAGLPAERFCFEGFLPPRAAARAARLHALRAEGRTMVVYEAAHRITATVAAMAVAFGVQRPAVVARELTKRFESFYRGTLAEVAAALAAAPHHRKGEFVILIGGAEAEQAAAAHAAEVMAQLMAEVPLARASRIAARLLPNSRNDLYALGLRLQDDAAGSAAGQLPVD